MRTALFAYCLGIYLVSLLPELSLDLALLVSSSWLCLLSLAILTRQKLLLLVSVGLVLGLLWHWWWGLRGLGQVLPAHLEGEDLTVEGVIVGLPLASSRGQRFELRLQAGQQLPAGGKLLLSYFAASEDDHALVFRPGEIWRLQVRLKQPHGFANPGTHDREAYLFRHGFIATGYVRGAVNRRLDSGQDNQLLGQNKFSVSALRHALLALLQPSLTELQYPDLVVALVLGENSQLESSRWQLFSATGTNHLFVISGLHIGLITLFIFQLCSRSVRLLPQRFNPWPVQQSAAWFAMMVAVAYSLLAGWGLPTQRACIMATLLLSSYLTRRRLNLGVRYLLALAVVLSIDPLAVTSQGFWLSFLAVAVLLFFSTHEASSWQHLIVPQWLIFVGLFVPLTLLVGQVSLLAPLANVLAIPVLGLVLLPILGLACILAVLGWQLAEQLLQAGDWILHGLMRFLQFLATDFSSYTNVSIPPLPPWLLLFVVPGVILLLLPRSMPHRWLAIPLLLSVLRTPPGMPVGQMRVQVLDVGQGLSVLVRTANHNLLYDTGPAIESSWSAGAAIVIPALRQLGVRRLDAIVISHGDTDHAGGLKAVSATFSDAKLISGEPIGIPSSPCSAQTSWVWDKVQFEMIYPVTSLPASSGTAAANNRSCVLHIRSDGFSLLLTGDIEEPVERLLASSVGKELQSNVLIAPHHGSKTSSSYPLLKMVAADHTIFTTGYGNGFGHPAAEVVQRHLQMNSALHNTAISGMISVARSSGANAVKVTHFRRVKPRYWAWSGNPVDCRYC